MGEKSKKQRLYQYRDIMTLIEELSEQIKELDERTYSISSKVITDMPRGGEHKNTFDFSDEKQDLIDRKLRMESMAKKKKVEVQQLIDTVLSPKHNRMLTKYFIQRFELNEIARQENYSVRQAYRIYHDGIKMAED